MAMADSFDPAQLTFDPPGPGSWRLDPVHVPRPWSPFHGEVFGPNVSLGSGESSRRYGALSGRGRFALVNGFGYGGMLPLDPAELPARIAAAEETFATRRWRADLALWEQQAKPVTIQSQLALQRINTAALSPEDQLAHITTCRDNLAAMIQQHHRFNMPATLPIADLIAHLRQWLGARTDPPLGAFLALVRGSAPESAGAMPELDRLAEALRADASSRALLAEADHAAVITRLRAAPGAVGQAACAYLDLVGTRVLDGLEVGAPTGYEVPEVLVKGISRAVDSGPPAPGRSTAQEEKHLLDALPAEHHATFHALLAEARHNSRLRDERGLYSDVWAAGICRTAIIATGTRLAAAGRLAHAAHLVEANWEEMQAILRNQGGPDADTLATRARYRTSVDASIAPATLGDPPKPPTLPENLPPAALRIARAMMASGEAMFGLPPETAPEPTRLRGTGSSPGTVTGTARVIRSPAEFGRLQPGDILVTSTTTESFNIVLPLLGGIVTDTGGLLSHAAIVSREYGIPGVVGTRHATKRIPDGATIRVDGLKGEVVLLP
jgi:phosphohistidine swiveling domain-containing protein